MGRTIYIACVDCEANNAPRVLVHDDHHPVTFQQDGFAAEQVEAVVASIASD